MHTAPRASRPNVTKIGTSPRPIVSKANIALASPIPVSTKPGRSNGRTVVSRRFSMNRLTSTTPSTPIGMLMKKIQRHEA